MGAHEYNQKSIVIFISYGMGIAAHLLPGVFYAVSIGVSLSQITPSKTASFHEVLRLIASSPKAEGQNNYELDISEEKFHFQFVWVPRW